jgi:hypothetical protein
VPAESSLAKLYPKVAEEWHPKLNKGLSPEQVMAKSGLIVWWRCHSCKYEWSAAINSRTGKGTSCYKCARNILDLTKKEHKFLLSYFDQKKNKGIDPTWVPTRAKIYWRCPTNSKHVWLSKVGITSQTDFCPFC